MLTWSGTTYIQTKSPPPRDKGKWAYVEVGNTDKIMTINSIEEFEKIYI